MTIVILVIAWSHLVSCNSGGSNIQALSRLSTSANRLIAEYKFDSAKLSIDSLKIIGADAAYVKAMEDAIVEKKIMSSTKDNLTEKISNLVEPFHNQVQPEIKENKTESKNVEKRKESKPKNYYGVWLGDAGRGQTYELYINTDGTWYFVNNWSRRDLGGFYVNKGGGSFDLMRPTDNSEKIVYNGLESITEFYFQAGGSNGSLRPNTNRAGLAFQDNVPFYIQ